MDKDFENFLKDSKKQLHKQLSTRFKETAANDEMFRYLPSTIWSEGGPSKDTETNYQGPGPELKFKLTRNTGGIAAEDIRMI